MQYQGSLSVFVTYAGGAFPLEGAVVFVSPNSKTNGNINQVRRTDINGKSGKMYFVAPNPSLSLNEGNGDSGYISLTVEVFLTNFYRKTVYEVSIFPGIETVLAVNLIPVSEYEVKETQPLGTSVVYSSPNQDL